MKNKDECKPDNFQANTMGHCQLVAFRDKPYCLGERLLMIRSKCKKGKCKLGSFLA